MNPKNREALPLTEAAEKLGTKPQTLRMRWKRGKVEGFKEKGRVFIWTEQQPHNVKEVVKAPEQFVQWPEQTESAPKGEELQRLVRELESQERDAGTGYGELAEAWAEDKRRLLEQLGQAGETTTEPADAGGEYDELAEEWAKDLRRQVQRLEGQVDTLQADLRDERDARAKEASEMRVLLQGEQKLVSDLRAEVQEVRALPAPAAEPKEERRQMRLVLAGVVTALGKLAGRK